jgi:predicted nucleic acid-binding protein
VPNALPFDFADASVVLLAMRADVREILTAAS